VDHTIWLWDAVAGYDDAVNLFTARGQPGFTGF
jgi:hypothetical protein